MNNSKRPRPDRGSWQAQASRRLTPQRPLVGLFHGGRMMNCFILLAAEQQAAVVWVGLLMVSWAGLFLFGGAMAMQRRVWR